MAHHGMSFFLGGRGLRRGQRKIISLYYYFGIYPSNQKTALLGYSVELKHKMVI